MPCAYGVPGSTISGSGCVVEAQRRGREGRRIAPACLSVLVSAATYLAQPFGIGNEFVRDGTIHLPYVWLAFRLGRFLTNALVLQEQEHLGIARPAYSGPVTRLYLTSLP
jgi:hypothetical protein